MDPRMTTERVMPWPRALALSLLLTSTSLAADLRTLTGAAHKGELHKLDDKNVVLRTDGGPVTVPVGEILQLDFVPPGDLPPLAKDPFLDLELTDGSLLHCRSFALKGKQAELQLLSGPKVTVPLSAITYVLND